MENPERYWLVHGNGPTNHRHDTEASAIAEAKRLARLCPGRTFFVLEAKKAFMKVDVQEMVLDDEIPF